MSLYEDKEYYDWLAPLCIVLAIVCFILFVWCGFFVTLEFYHGNNACYGEVYANEEGCIEFQEKHGYLTEEEISSKEDLWLNRTLISMISAPVFLIGAIVTYRKKRILAGEIETFELKLSSQKAEEKRRQQEEDRKDRIMTEEEAERKAERKQRIDLARNLWDKGGLENLLKALSIYLKYHHDVKKIEGDIAKEKEKHLDYDGAIADFERLGLHKSASRVRRKKMDDMKTEQTVIHGDYVDDRDTTYVDDRDTIVQDSVISKSNIGAAGKSKSEELREAKALLDEGLINEDDYEKMKKEILGK